MVMLRESPSLGNLSTLCLGDNTRFRRDVLHSPGFSIFAIYVCVNFILLSLSVFVYVVCSVFSFII